MMEINSEVNLKPYNTFGIAVKANRFIEVNSVDELRNVLSQPSDKERLILGGGSNMLLTSDLDYLVIHVNIKGIRVLWEDESHVVLKVMAGENWHDFVQYAVNKGYGGIENLSLIPGNMGTAPIQNIGAYGVELCQVLESCEAMEIATTKLRSFSNAECQFGYRDSFFKNEGKGKYIVTSVTLKLTKKNHSLNTSYGAISEELKNMGINDPGIEAISQAVIAIRRRKLPDPAELGNSGSFFKNPVIDIDHYTALSKNFPELPHYVVDEKQYKVPAGWLIEHCGYKGMRRGDAGVHKNQALVLVNYGDASGKEILDLAREIKDSVKEKFSIELQPEVNILGDHQF